MSRNRCAAENPRACRRAPAATTSLTAKIVNPSCSVLERLSQNRRARLKPESGLLRDSIAKYGNPYLFECSPANSPAQRPSP
jgi:hypothetical protein